MEKTNIKDISNQYAKFDLSMICEDRYSSLKHIDMVVFTILKNQESLSINSAKMGNMRYVDSNGYVFISISQEKLCRILRTSKPTLIASFDRLEKVELIERVRQGQMICNRMYIGNPISTITLGDYIKRIGIELDEEMKKEDNKPKVNVTNINNCNKKAPAPTEAINKEASQNTSYIDNILISNNNNTINEEKNKEEIKNKENNIKIINILKEYNFRGIDNKKANTLFKDENILLKAISRCKNIKEFNYLVKVYDSCLYEETYNNKSQGKGFNSWEGDYVNDDDLDSKIEKMQQNKYGKPNIEVINNFSDN